MAHNSEPGRRGRILDAAESAFAEFGFAGASLRRIVLEAGVNLATVYYYFGSKAGLAAAVLRRRFEPLRQEQLARLRRFEAEARGRPLAVEKILEAMLVPSLRLAEANPTQHRAVTRLIGRIATEPNAQIQEILRGQRADTRAAFIKAFRFTFPDLPAPDLHWRLEFVRGALAFILCNPRQIEEETRGACDPQDTSRVLGEMIRFFAPGFRAPANGSAKSDSRSAKREGRGSGAAGSETQIRNSKRKSEYPKKPDSAWERLAQAPTQ